MLIYFSDYDYSIYCIMIDLYFPVINLYSGQSLIYYFFRYDYTVYLYLNYQRLSCTTCIIDLCYLSILFIHNIHFIYFSMIDLYPNLKITWFSLWFFYDYLSQYDWLILLSYHSFILSIYSICFIMIDLYYWCNQLLIYTIFVLFYLSNLTLFHLFNKMQMTIYSIKWQ